MVKSNYYGKLKRDEIKYEQMIYRCEIHNAQAKTITRQATPEETEYYQKLLEQDKHNRELMRKEKERSYGCEVKYAKC